MGPIAAPARPDGARARRADPRDRAARRRPGARPPARRCDDVRRRRRPGAGVAEAHRRIRARDRHARQAIASPGPDLAAVRWPSSTTARLVELAGARLARRDRGHPDRRRHRRGDLPIDPAVRGSGLRPPDAATTGRTPTAARRPPGLPGSSRRRRAAARPAAPVATRSPPTATSRSTTRSRPRRDPGPAFNPFAIDDDEPDRRTRSRRRRRPGRPSAPTRRASSRSWGAASAVFGSYAKVLLVDDVAVVVRPVRAAVRVSAGAAPARALPAAARRAAAGGDHLHRDDRRRRAIAAMRSDSSGRLRRPCAGAASRRSRPIPERGARPDATSAATPEFWLTVGFSRGRRRRAVSGRPPGARLMARDGVVRVRGDVRLIARDRAWESPRWR